jgi:hypothetical protein
LVTGKLDALVFALGVFVGALVFGDLFPVWKDFYVADALGVLRLDQVLGIGLGPAILLVVVVAVGGSIGLRRLQQYFWHNVRGPLPWHIRALVGLALLAGLALAFVPNRSFFAITDTAGSCGGWEQGWEDPCESVLVDPLSAGRIAYRYQDRLRWFDLREPAQYRAGHLTSAAATTAQALEAMPLDRATVMLVYGTRGDPQVLDTVKALRRRGLRAFAVVGGFEALERYYIAPLSADLKARLGAAKLAELARYRALWSTSQGPQGGGATP